MREVKLFFPLLAQGFSSLQVLNHLKLVLALERLLGHVDHHVPHVKVRLFLHSSLDLVVLNLIEQGLLIQFLALLFLVILSLGSQCVF